MAAQDKRGRQDLEASDLPSVDEQLREEIAAFVMNDDLDVSSGGVLGVSWEGIQSSSRVQRDFELLQWYRKRGLV